MTRSAFALAATLLLTAAASAQNQDAERTEDIEVLRRILNNSLGLPDRAETYPEQPTSNLSGSSTTPSPQFIDSIGGQPISGSGQFYTIYWTERFPRINAPVGPFDGVYLTGHGVVYTLRVPQQAGVVLDPPAKAVGLTALCGHCHSPGSYDTASLELDPSPSKQPSEWDRTRGQLHGKQSTATPPPAPTLTRQQICNPGNLAERLTTKLAANVKHIRHLPPGERITVVVTFDGVGKAGQPQQTTNDPISGEVQGSQPLTLVKKGQPVPHGFTVEEAQQLTLGDLHLKQNKPKEAATAYERALARYKEPVFRLPVVIKHMDSDRMKTLADESRKEVRATYAKLAQAHLAAGDTDKAAAALDLARKFKIELTDSAEAQPAAPAVPAKLMLSVTKADLDKADDDLAAFKAAVKLDLTGFPPPDKKK